MKVSLPHNVFYVHDLNDLCITRIALLIIIVFIGLTYFYRVISACAGEEAIGGTCE